MLPKNIVHVFCAISIRKKNEKDEAHQNSRAGDVTSLRKIAVTLREFCIVLIFLFV